MKDNFLKDVKIGNVVELIVGPKEVDGTVIALDMETVRIKKENDKEAVFLLEAITFYEVIEENVIFDAIENDKDNVIVNNNVCDDIVSEDASKYASEKNVDTQKIIINENSLFYNPSYPEYDSCEEISTLINDGDLKKDVDAILDSINYAFNKLHETSPDDFKLQENIRKLKKRISREIDQNENSHDVKILKSILAEIYMRCGSESQAYAFAEEGFDNKIAFVLAERLGRNFIPFAQRHYEQDEIWDAYILKKLTMYAISKNDYTFLWYCLPQKSVEDKNIMISSMADLIFGAFSDYDCNKSYSIGIISFFNAYYGSGNITPLVYYQGDDKICDKHLRINFLKNEVEYGNEEINTKEYNYLVVFEINTNDYAHKIHILDKKAKKISKPILEKSFVLKTGMVPRLIKGESFFAISDTGKIILDYFDKEDDGVVYGKNGCIINREQQDMYRFAIISGFDSAFQSAFLNNMLEIDLSLVETKTYNMLKTARKSMLVCYCYAKNEIANIMRVGQDVIDELEWREGVVDKVDASVNERKVVIDRKVYHYLTVLSDGLINKKSNEVDFPGTDVFFKCINCPNWSESNIEEIAASVRCTQETARIEFDIVKNSYIAYRNNTFFYGISGNREKLKKCQGEIVPVYFTVDSRRTSLLASIDMINEGEKSQPYNVEEEYDGNEINIGFENLLGNIYLDSIDFSKMSMPRNVKIAADGWPENINQEREMLDFLLRDWMTAEQIFAAAKLVSHLNEKDYKDIFEKKKIKSESLLRLALNRKAQEIAWNSDGNLDEYTYLYLTIIKVAGQVAKLKNLYGLFVQDVISRNELAKEMRQIDNRNYVTKQRFIDLFLSENARKSADKILKHLLKLDEISYEYVTDAGFYDNKFVMEDLIIAGKQIESNVSDEPDKMVLELRKIYKDDKMRFITYLAQDGRDIVEKVSGTLDIILQRFSKMCGDTDRVSFEKIANVCSKIIGNVNASLLEKEKGLLEGYTIVNAIYEENLVHPTLEITELLINTGALHKLREYIRRSLNDLYSSDEFKPKIRCFPNEYEIRWEDGQIDFVIENGDAYQDNIQKAFEVQVLFESTDLNNDFFQHKVFLGELEASSQKDFSLKIDLSEWTSESFHLSWSVEYKRCIEFLEEQRFAIENKESNDIIEIQRRKEFDALDKSGKENPYMAPAKGEALKTNEMFFGRKREINEIWEYISGPSGISRGRTVIVYGQKKCGKSSLINQIVNRIKDDNELSEKTIVISFNNILQRNGNATGLPFFDSNLQINILKELEKEIHNRPDLERILVQNNQTIPNVIDRPYSAAAEFTSCIKFLNSVENQKYSIVLIMDEFTLLCSAIMDKIEQNPEFRRIPNFIKEFAELGITQIIIGHDSMMRALGKLGVINHTSEFAKKIEISALNEKEAIEIIKLPMQKIFERDLYETPLGESAINYLLKMSGCSPLILMKMCNEIFSRFIEDSSKNIITKPEVEKWINEFVRNLDRTTFDMLLTEDSDQAMYFENLPTYKYLLHVAKNMDKSADNKCSSSDYCQELSKEENDSVRETLIDRQVLDEAYGRIYIKMGLFPLYLKYRYGF